MKHSGGFAMKKKCVYVLLICILTLSIGVYVSLDVYADPAFEINAKSAVLMEASTGQVLYEKNGHEKLPPASVTKVMTMLLIMEALEYNKIALDDIVTCSEYASSMGGSQIYLAAGEKMSVEDLLKAIAVASGNDASVAMAEHIYGSEEAFVKAMNDKAKALGMNNTHFVNCNGLDAEEHYTTAYDIALMSRELLKYTKIHDYLTIWMDTLRDGQFGLANTNKMIRFYEGATGIKTGSTSKALYCLSASAKRNDMQLIATIMAAPTSQDRFSYASKLLDNGFANYTVLAGIKEGATLGEIEVLKGMMSSARLQAESEFEMLVEKGKEKEVKKIVSISENILAPVEQGQKAGEIKFELGGKELGRVNIITSQSVKKITVGKVFSKMVQRWLNAR